MLIAVDFDGVIHNPDARPAGHRMGVPIAGAVDALDSLLAAGHTVVVHTVRDNSDGHVGRWLDYFGIDRSIPVTNFKPNADLFIDDKAIRFTDWDSVLKQMV